MVVLTAKVNLKRILLILGLIAAVLIGTVWLLGKTEATAAPLNQKLTDNDARVKFLRDFGWEVVSVPKESGQVLIPSGPNQVFDRYNALQKCQGYDLSKFAGKKVMRYVYEIKNYPGATEPVLATLLCHKGRVIGGDITNTAPGGKLQGFAMGSAAPQPSASSTPTMPTVPATETTPPSAGIQ